MKNPLEIFEINKTIIEKINKSELEEPLKELLIKILQLEFKEGRTSRYSESYNQEIEKAYILLRKKK